jgi:hypothetical protein
MVKSRPSLNLMDLKAQINLNYQSNNIMRTEDVALGNQRLPGASKGYYFMEYYTDPGCPTDNQKVSFLEAFATDVCLKTDFGGVIYTCHDNGEN